jgi:hypothetical protein
MTPNLSTPIPPQEIILTRGRERRRLGHGSSFSTGDTRQRATKDVIAISWDQVHKRARSTTRCTVTATRSLDRPL